MSDQRRRKKSSIERPLLGTARSSSSHTPIETDSEGECSQRGPPPSAHAPPQRDPGPAIVWRPIETQFMRSADSSSIQETPISPSGTYGRFPNPAPAPIVRTGPQRKKAAYVDVHSTVGSQRAEIQSTSQSQGYPPYVQQNVRDQPPPLPPKPSETRKEPNLMARLPASPDLRRASHVKDKLSFWKRRKKSQEMEVGKPVLQQSVYDVDRLGASQGSRPPPSPQDFRSSLLLPQSQAPSQSSERQGHSGIAPEPDYPGPQFPLPPGYSQHGSRQGEGYGGKRGEAETLRPPVIPVRSPLRPSPSSSTSSLPLRQQQTATSSSRHARQPGAGSSSRTSQEPERVERTNIVVGHRRTGAGGRGGDGGGRGHLQTPPSRFHRQHQRQFSDGFTEHGKCQSCGREDYVDGNRKLCAYCMSSVYSPSA